MATPDFLPKVLGHSLVEGRVGNWKTCPEAVLVEQTHGIYIDCLFGSGSGCLHRGHRGLQTSVHPLVVEAIREEGNEDSKAQNGEMPYRSHPVIDWIKNHGLVFTPGCVPIIHYSVLLGCFS